MKETEELWEVEDGSQNDEVLTFDDFEDYDDDIYDFAPKATTSRGAWTSLVLGVIATLGWIVPIIGLPITVVGIVLGAMNFNSKKAKGAAISGFVVNIIFLLATIAKGIVDVVRFCKKKR